MKKLIKKFEAHYEEWAYYTTMVKNEPRWPDEEPVGEIPINRLRFLWEMIPHWCREMVCAYRGHRIVSVDSWATPDTGGETHECSRCHRSWSHTYY